MHTPHPFGVSQTIFKVVFAVDIPENCHPSAIDIMQSITTTFLSLIYIIALIADFCTASLVIKVNCPNDEKIREIITQRRQGDDFQVQCANPLTSESMNL